MSTTVIRELSDELDALKRAVREADLCLQRGEGVNLLYYMTNLRTGAPDGVDTDIISKVLESE